MHEVFSPAVTAVINGVWESHQGLAEDQITSVLHEAVKATGEDIPEDEYTRVARDIADGTYR